MIEQTSAKPIKPHRLLPSHRALTALIVFFGTCILYMLRINISVVIVCMTLQQNVTDIDGANSSSSTSSASDASNKLIYNWDRDIQGKILSSFFFGYMLMQIPAGLMTQRFAPKHVITCLTCLAAVSTLLVPPAAAVSWKLVLALRVVTGLGSSVMFPGLHQLWSYWAPPLERSKLVGFSYAGAPIGVIVGLLLSAYLCSTIGWQYVFYLFGSLCLLWVAAWCLLVYNSPDEHPFIDEEEKKYIRRKLFGEISASVNQISSQPFLQETLCTHEKQQQSEPDSTQPEVVVIAEKKHKLCSICSCEQKQSRALLPVAAVAKSLPFWAIIVANVAYDWGGYTFITSLPTFLKDSYDVSLAANGMLSCLPYIGFFIVQIVSSYLADLLQERQCLSTKNTRKLMTCISMILPALIISSIFVNDYSSQWVPMLLLMLAISFNGCGFSGMLVNHVDIAPMYAGILLAISNTMASLSGVLAPIVMSTLTSDGTFDQWRTVFMIAAAVQAAGSIFYSIFAEGSVQHWAVTNHDLVKDKKLVKNDIDFYA